MILSNAALNWASVRSGLGLGDFLSSLTPEREQEILKAYNAWRRSKGLPEDKPVAPTPSVPTAPTPPPAKREESAIAQLMEQIADEVEKEQEEDAILIGETIEQIDSTPIEWVPEEIVEEIATMDEEEPEAPSVDIDEETDMDAAEEAPDAPALLIKGDDTVPAPAEDAPALLIKGDEPVPTPAEDAPALLVRNEELSLFDRLSAVARTLPKSQDPALYESLLADLGCSVEEARETAEDVRKHFTAKHRSTVGIRSFMEWLSK